MSQIPFNRPTQVGHEFEYMREALRRGLIAGDGHFTRQCHAYLEKRLGISKALLTTSCTHALEMAALLLDIQPDDEIICPSFTFVSTINAFALRGGRPVFCDVRPDTLNLDEALLERLLTTRTRAIVVVHYAGVACEMDAIMEVAQRKNIPVIEDNAHGLFGRYKGRYLGTFGAAATQSFHETKNFTSGEGGALLINDAKYIEEAEIIREKGTNRSRFFRGQVDKYTWVGLGSSYLPSDMLAGFLWAQLEKADEIQLRRHALWERYAKSLKGWADDNGVRLPIVPKHCDQAFHMFYLLFPDLRRRQAAIGHLRTRGVHAVFHYLPLHLSPMGSRFGGAQGDCPVTERISDQLLRIPFFTGMTDDEQTQVIEAICEIRT